MTFLPFTRTSTDCSLSPVVVRISRSMRRFTSASVSGSVRDLLRALAEALDDRSRDGAAGDWLMMRPSTPGNRQGAGLVRDPAWSDSSAAPAPRGRAEPTRSRAELAGVRFGCGSSSSGSSVSGIDGRDDASGTGAAGTGTVGRNGEPIAGGLGNERTEFSVVARSGFARLDGNAVLVLSTGPGRWAGDVTPGITSIGLTGGGEEGVEGAVAADTGDDGDCGGF